MNNRSICITKRDGTKEEFFPNKIGNAIKKAYASLGLTNHEEEIRQITDSVINKLSKDVVGVEEIQDIVEKELMKIQPEVAKKYIIYRDWRNTEREKKKHYETHNGRHRCDRSK